MFKKIYIEITNVCNLDCPFCVKTKRKKEFMTYDDFKIIIDKIKPYTDYVYLHVMGEALLNKDINKFIKYAKSRGLYVNITTNGRFLDKLKEMPRQINISLQSYYNELESLPKLYEKCEKLANIGIFINYRIWTFYDDIVFSLENYYNIKLQGKSGTIKKNIFYSIENEFTWPISNINMEEGSYSPTFTCRALKDHIAILVDGTVVPCCVDSEGLIKLGNIYDASINEIMNNPTYKCILNGFNNNKKVFNLCKNCNFYQTKKEASKIITYKNKT